jgi:hypothetical protein
VAAGAILVLTPSARAQHALGTIADRKPDAIVDLRTEEGA